MLQKRRFLIFIVFLVSLMACQEDKPVVQITKAKISGFVQKGPFVTGTTILMNELNGKLEQSGRSFSAAISNDYGAFEINNILLGSPYIEVTASGYYFNEVSGELSNSQIVLSSLSNLQDKNSVNVNVLTHLEKERVRHLIGERFSFADAKSKSRSEVLSIFSNSLSGSTSFEDFDVLKNNDEGAVLLAISIILQNKRTVGQLTELLSRIQQDIAADGTLDDQDIIKALRFGIMDLDLNQIRKNIEARFLELKINNPVPDFEGHIIAFAKLKNLNLSIVGNGIVQERIVPGQNGRSYPQGVLVELTAVPDPGWVFKGWGGDLSGSESPKQLLMDGPKNVIANFSRKDYLLNITIEGEGSVNEVIVFNPVGRSYPYQTVVELTPIPATGWVFDHWVGDLSGSAIPERITVNKEQSVGAVFRKPVFRMHTNGVTCVCENVKPGEKGLINGIEYEAVDNQLLRTRRDEGKDLTKVCTSLVTNLYELFFNKTFNQPIGNWDVSNVTTLDGLFRKSNFNQDISSWDVGNVTSMAYLFSESPFNKVIGDWNVGKVTEMGFMFANSNFNQDIGKWDVSKVNSMALMFSSSKFNQDISSWNVGNVRSMHRMFEFTPFNQPIGTWNVSNVTNMDQMFRETPFNQPIGGWDVSNVTSVYQMFMNTPFNQPLGNWNVSNIMSMDFLFANSNFNQDIGNWDVGRVTSMALMFANSRFNQNISKWNVANVRSMHRMFEYTPFNQPIGSWNVSNVTNMDQMLRETPFNQPIGAWDVSNVSSMYQMFMNTPFNQPIGNWNVGNVVSTDFMFANSGFNQDIGNWNVSRVGSMILMFSNSAFNQDVSKWNVASVRNMHRMFEGSPFNKPIGSWNVSAVTDMSQMFNFSSFNQDIGNWNVSNVRSLHHMFYSTPFNQDISRWCVSSFQVEPDGFSLSSPLTEANKPKWGTCPQ